MSELKDVPVQTKVRFLGWYSMSPFVSCTVLRYCLSIESFEVGSDEAIFSYRSTSTPIPTIARVSLEAVLGTPSLSLEVGTWMNVIGYVRGADSPAETRTVGGTSGREKKRKVPVHEVVQVQALMAWEAGDVNLADYEEAVLAKRGSD
ncbi:putative telomere capping, CST complex subunit [Elsinoe australis]|uniref:Putative telomere capping, CST complex subunit n=1 Tax=Elsinoe australis TaxID=40998 RepID=A0A4U7AYQ1_9PEZI|nr:putative telomere capping, CST complex subunit [Elsinoe australis]